MHEPSRGEAERLLQGRIHTVVDGEDPDGATRAHFEFDESVVAALAAAFKFRRDFAKHQEDPWDGSYETSLREFDRALSALRARAGEET